jgi:SAM-dependent methyltransferase
MKEILAREETHDWMIDGLSKERKGFLLDVPAGTGSLASRLKKLGFSASCCHIHPSLFSVHDVEIMRRNLNQSLPYPSGSFDFITCLEGLEHLEIPFNTIREFYRILKPGGKVFLSLPNTLNIERRLRFLITGLFSKIPSPERLGKDRFVNLWMHHLTPLSYAVLELALEHWGFKTLGLGKDKEKKRMKWLLHIIWTIRRYSFFWPKEAKEKYHLEDTLSPTLIMGGNALISVAEKREDGRVVLEK